MSKKKPGQIGKMLWDAVNDSRQAAAHAAVVLRISSGQSFADTNRLMQYLEGHISDEDLLAMFKEIRSQTTEEHGKGFDRIFGIGTGIIMFHAKMVLGAIEKEFNIEPQDDEQHNRTVEIVRTELDIERLEDPEQLANHMNGILEQIGIPPMPDELINQIFGDLGASRRGAKGFTVYGEEDGFNEEEFE